MSSSYVRSINLVGLPLPLRGRSKPTREILAREKKNVLHCIYIVITNGRRKAMEKTETYTFRLEKELKDEFNQLAERIGVPGSQMIRRYMNLEVERAKAESKRGKK